MISEKEGDIDNWIRFAFKLLWLKYVITMNNHITLQYNARLTKQ